jgi:hypothetical protein
MTTSSDEYLDDVSVDEPEPTPLLRRARPIRWSSDG